MKLLSSEEIRWSRVQIPSGPLITKMVKKESKTQADLVEIDVSKHILVPKHSKMSEEEVEALLEKYNISKTQLPRILQSDPAIEPLELEIGDVVSIERKSPTVGKSIYYRVVVHG